MLLNTCYKFSPQISVLFQYTELAQVIILPLFKELEMINRIVSDGVVWISVHRDTPHQTLFFSVGDEWNLFYDVIVL